MIEAVNSTVANASVLRASAEQANSSRIPQVAQAALPEAGVELPQAPYISPYISVDLNYDKAVLLIRDSETGDVVQQFPTESRLVEIRRAKVALESRQLTSATPQKTQASQQQNQPAPQTSKVDTAPVPQQSSPTIHVSAEIITVQAATSVPPANVTVSPQIAAAALSASAQSTVSASASAVSVLA